MGSDNGYMRSPLIDGPLIGLQTVDSTQAYAAAMLRRGEPVGAVYSLEQTAGRGRFGRPWHSPRGTSLSVSMVFPYYVGHPRPYLIGMSLAVACARAFDCQLQWPNDLVYEGRKLGGILTEMSPDAEDRSVPVVGVGINLNQTSFEPDIADRATSLLLAHGKEVMAVDALDQILTEFEALPEIREWSDLAPFWNQFDATPGKRYRLRDGQEAIATGVGSQGELLCVADGAEHSALAADALMGV